MYPCRGSMWLLVLLACGLSACDGNTRLRDLQQYVDNLQKKTMTMVDKNVATGIPLPRAAQYRADELRAPFATQQRILVEKGAVASDSIQSYPLTALRFVGTVTKQQVTYAFVLTPGNIVYQVKQGDIIGDHYGKITEIHADRLSVAEQVFENGKPTSQRVTTLQLKDEHS